MMILRFFTVFFIVIFQCVYAQNLKKTVVKEVTNEEVFKILTSLQSHQVLAGKKLTINVFKVSNGSGSAHVSGDDEVSENYYFTVTDSSGDENPIYKVFSLGPFYGSKILSKKDFGDLYKLTIQHYNFGKLEVHSVKIDSKKLIYN